MPREPAMIRIGLRLDRHIASVEPEWRRATLEPLMTAAGLGHLQGTPGKQHIQKEATQIRLSSRPYRVAVRRLTRKNANGQRKRWPKIAVEGLEHLLRTLGKPHVLTKATQNPTHLALFRGLRRVPRSPNVSICPGT